MKNLPGSSVGAAAAHHGRRGAASLLRSSGVQLHITSLPGGRLGPDAYRFVDWLAGAGQTWWQVLPLGPPDRHGSPYKARSAFAARGYELTTIRAVAAQAGIDASMVMRYFGSKAGLFTAAATMDLQIPDLTATPAARRGELLVRHLVERWEDGTRAPWPAGANASCSAAMKGR